MSVRVSFASSAVRVCVGVSVVSPVIAVPVKSRSLFPVNSLPVSELLPVSISVAISVHESTVVLMIVGAAGEVHVMLAMILSALSGIIVLKTKPPRMRSKINNAAIVNAFFYEYVAYTY